MTFVKVVLYGFGTVAIVLGIFAVFACALSSQFSRAEGLVWEDLDEDMVSPVEDDAA